MADRVPPESGRPSRLFYDYDGPVPLPRPGDVIALPDGPFPWSGKAARVDTAHGRKLTVEPYYRYPQWRVDLFRADNARAASLDPGGER